MATIVFGAIGTLIGGPLGGAIGSLLGNQLDRKLIGGRTVKGPRVGDLSVQTSTYGTMIPRIYGTMRAAGTVIWSTDLKEKRKKSGGGKGQPKTVSYSYSVSLAVALSSRPAVRVRRIWADGKLIRDTSDRFAVKTKFRFHPGSETQPIDPLIATIEGAANAPAYRGLALAIFEDLALEEFGNRIPQLTFEIEGDTAAPALGGVLADISKGNIVCPSSQAIAGYAAHGSDIRSAVQPLVESFGIDLVERGPQLRSASSATPLGVAANDLGSSSDAKAVPRIERQQSSAATLPAMLTLNYYERARDYQAGQAHASTGLTGRRTDQLDLPAVLEAGIARSLAEQALARRWAQRERVTLRLPPTFLALMAGDPIRFDGDQGSWRADRVTIEQMVVIAELVREVGQATLGLPAEAGRPVIEPGRIIARTILRIFDIPFPPGLQPAGPLPTLVVAATSAAPSWRAVPLEASVGALVTPTQTADQSAVMGSLKLPLGGAPSTVLDLSNVLEVELAKPDMWLESRDDDALARGENLAVVGDELIQFGSAEQIDPLKWRLSRLLRGRYGTEWATANHLIGDGFALLEVGSLQPIALAPSDLGATVAVTAFGLGDENSPGTASKVATGESLRPPSPVHLMAELSAGDLTTSWVRRSRFGWSWIDFLDVPLGESAERYRLKVQSASGSVETETSVPQATLTATALAGLAGRPWTISVVQIGDFALSHETRTTLL